MLAVLKRTLAATIFLAASVSAIHAQQPTPAQVEQALKTRPELAPLVRSRIAGSGLSPDQIRARLRAAGYPEDLLDSYLSSSSPDSGAAPSDDVLQAARFLGLVDSLDIAARSELPPATPRSDSGAARRPMTEAADSDRIFGLDVFRRSTSQFEPTLAGPVDANYRVGPRDVLALIITGGVQNSYTLEVTREGFVVIPQVGQVYVANLTLGQVDDVLYQRLRQVYSSIGRGPGASTRFYVTVARLRTNQIFVVGDASAPGSYQVSSAGTMLTALYAAGGPTVNGSLRNIELRRGGNVVSQLDVYDYLTRGDASKDARLLTGDVIFVPVHGPRVQVKGEIIRPARYELLPGETLQDLLRMAGGFTAKAGRQRVLVRRIVPPTQRSEGGRDRTVLDITSDQFATGYGPAVPLVDGDIVEVFSVPERVRNLVTVAGAVWTPGPQGFTAGMTLSDALRRAGGVRPDVRDVLITRLQSDQSRIQLRADVVDTLGTLRDDMLLQEDDSIRVFAATDFRPERYVVITGAVRGGGRFQWHEGMTLRDLVHLSGGLADGAYLVNAEVARMPEDRSGGTLSLTTTVPLDSTYLLERGFDGEYNGPPGVQTQNDSVGEYRLEPYDNVLILRQPDWELDQTVVVQGEVRFPGEYALKSKQDKISDVISRAGGLTPRAYLAGAVFTRPRGGLGRIGIDLEGVMKQRSSRDNLTLLAGDTLFIPQFKPTVKVEGSVNSPISVAYVPGYHLTDYIDAAGGPTYTADLGRAFVRQPNGIVAPFKNRWFLIPDSDPTPLPGAVVVVPAKDPDDRRDWGALVAPVAQILASTVAIVVLVTRK